MEADDEQPELLRFPETPFEVQVLIKQIFGNLGYADLQNCCLVSRSWNDSASKILLELRQLDDAFRRVQCRLIPSEAEFRTWLRNKRRLFVMENEQELWDLLRTRKFPGSRDSLPLPHLRFSYATPSFIKSMFSPLFRFGENMERCAFFSASYDRTIAGFLTNPLLSDLIGSVMLDRQFSDLGAVLGILTKLPNLKELNLKLEVLTTGTSNLGPDGAFSMSEAATSNVQKLEVEFVKSFETPPVSALRERLELELEKYISEIFKVCGDLHIFRLVDLRTEETQKISFNLQLFASLKRPASLNKFEIRNTFREIFPNQPNKIHLLNALSNLQSLDLRNWTRLPLADWNMIATNSSFLPNLESLHLYLHHSECPQQLLWNPSNGRPTLKRLTLDVSWRDNPLLERSSLPFRWQEGWKVLQGEPLTLTSATLFANDTGGYDNLNSFPHLFRLTLVSSEVGLQGDRTFTLKPGRPVLYFTWEESQRNGQNLIQPLTLTHASIYSLESPCVVGLESLGSQHVTLRVRKTALAAAFATAPSSVKQLEIALPKEDYILTLSKNEQNSAAGNCSEVSGAVDAVQLGQFCSRCRLHESVGKCVYSKEQKKINRLVEPLDPLTPGAGQIWTDMELATEDNCQLCCGFALLLSRVSEQWDET